MKRFNSRCPWVLMAAGAAVILLLPLRIAGAQTGSPCDDDFSKYCSDVTPGGGRLVACYEKNKNKMSAGCKAWAEGAKANAGALSQACSEEIDQACTAEKGDPLGMINCLQAQYISLSPGCIQQLNQFKYLYPQVTTPPPGQ
jgi:hypothetical protein